MRFDTRFFMRAPARGPMHCDGVACARPVGAQPAVLPLAGQLSDLSLYPRWPAFVTLALNPVWRHRGRCVQIQQRENCHAWRRPLLADACMGAMLAVVGAVGGNWNGIRRRRS